MILFIIGNFRLKICYIIKYSVNICSWHDKSEQIENDRMKNETFEKTGMKLHRLRNKKNKNMDEIFELYIKKNYVWEQSNN